MTDGDALLRAILQAPDDDAPRLVYGYYTSPRPFAEFEIPVRQPRGFIHGTV